MVIAKLPNWLFDMAIKKYPTNNRTRQQPEKDVRFEFMRVRKIAATASVVAVLVSVAAVAHLGLNFGLDFTGGTLVEVAYAEAVSPDDVRAVLEAANFQDVLVQNFGGSVSGILVRLPVQAGGDAASIGDNVLSTLRGEGREVALRRAEFVGPVVGEELREQGGIALISALGLVMLYIVFRFLFKFSVGAVVALAHDVIITLGAFSLFRWDFDLSVLAALLAVIGYSLNDTIVVSDRIRENFRRWRSGKPEHVINVSLNQTLGRTLVTSFTTLLVLFSLLIFGGELIRGFAVALIIGVVVGTYSSIYVAANVLLAMDIQRADLLLPEKEGADQRSSNI